MRDWNRSRIGSNRPGATRQDAQMEVRDMGMSTIQFRLAPPMKPVIEPASCQTFRRPSGTPQRGAAWRWLVYHLSGSHVSRCVVSATASSRHRAFELSQLEIECKTPTALLGRISCECRSGWQCGALPCMASGAAGAFCLSRARRWMVAAGSSTRPRWLLR